ncbi:MAG: DMT family transporter [Candidatus Thermoplasmatota archaeon]|nr:DMT family transporter [Candidatus Thermoplasmatota archaeon]
MNNIVIHLKLFSVAVIWGLGWPAGRVVANDILPFAASWLRYVIATVSFLMFMQMSGQWMFPNRSEWRRLFMIGFISTVMYQAFFMFGMQYTAAGDASLMITFNPLFTAILAVVFIGERMHLNLIIGLFMGITGVAILFYYSPNVDLPFSERVLGNMLIACAALSWACNTILMKRAMTSPANAATRPLNPLELTVWSSVAGLLILTPITVAEAMTQGVSVPSQSGWIGIVFLALFSTVIAYVWFADGIVKIGASMSALYVYLVPPFGIIGGFVLLGEKLGVSLLFAFVLITGGVIIAQRDSPQTSNHDEAKPTGS